VERNFMTYDTKHIMDLHTKATGGNWMAATARSSIVGCPVVSAPEGRAIASTHQGVDDAAFIAAAHSAIPALVAEIERLQEIITRLLETQHAEECQECAIGRTPQWSAARAAVENHHQTQNSPAAS
jgi:hypothetical protein